MLIHHYKNELRSTLSRAEYALNNIHFEEGLRIAKVALRAAKKNDCLESEAEALLLISKYFMRMADYAAAHEKADQAYEMFSLVRSTRAIDTQYHKGLIFSYQRQFGKAFETFEKVLRLAEQSHYTTGIALAKIDLALAGMLGERDPEETSRFLQEASCLVDTLHKPLVTARYYNISGVYNYHRSNYDTALQYWNTADSIYREVKNSYELLNVLHNQGNGLRNIGKTDRAIACLEEMLSLAQGIGYVFSEGVAAMALASLRNGEGNYKKALELCFHALSQFRKINNQANTAFALTNIALIYEHLGILDIAIRYYKEAQVIYRQLGVKRGLASHLANLAKLLSRCSEYESAQALVTESLEIAEHLGRLDTQVFCHEISGRISLGTGNRALALQHYHQGLTLARQTGLTAQSLELIIDLAYCVMDEENYSSAEQYFLEALAILRDLVVKVASIRAKTGLAWLYHRTGRYDESESLYQEALAESRAINNKILSSELHKRLSDLYKSRNNITMAFEHFEHYHQLQQEIFSTETRNMLANITLAFEVEPLQHKMNEMQTRTAVLELELERKNRELTALSMKLSRRDELLETIQGRIELSLDGDRENKKAARELLRTIKSNYSHEQNWNIFEEQFLQVHPEFTTRLLNRHPGLTPTEIRICCYLRINLNSKQICEMLNVTLNNINIHRAHIRKKMHLDKQNNLVAYLSLI